MSSEFLLAAELGKNLLEINNKLEKDLHSKIIQIDDQIQQINFLNKQVLSMKELAAKRTKLCEQLEISMIDLEKTNLDLAQKRETDKKRIKTLCESIEYLEKKCEELSGTLDTMTNSNNSKKRLSENFFNFGTSSDSSENSSLGSFVYKRKSMSLQDLRTLSYEEDEFDSNLLNESPNLSLKLSENELISTLEARLEELHREKEFYKNRVEEVECQFHQLTQENVSLRQEIVKIILHKDSLAAPLSPSLHDINKFSHFPNSIKSPSLACQNKLCTRCDIELPVKKSSSSYAEDGSEEFSSLEFELAQATNNLDLELDENEKDDGVENRNKSNFVLYDKRRMVAERDVPKNYDFERPLRIDNYWEDGDRSAFSDLKEQKIKLPLIIPDEFEKRIATNKIIGFDEMSMRDATEVKIKTKNRSIFWWGLWMTMLFVGLVQFIWEVVSILFWILLSLLLPSSLLPQEKKNKKLPILLLSNSKYTNSIQGS